MINSKRNPLDYEMSNNAPMNTAAKKRSGSLRNVRHGSLP